MALFGRKKKGEDESDFENEDEEELELNERRADRKLSRKFKDLNKENKRKRKEPPKPWGKKERLMVLIVFLATIIIATILSLSSRGYKLNGYQMKFSLPNIGSFKLFKDETIELRK